MLMQHKTALLLLALTPSAYGQAFNIDIDAVPTWPGAGPPQSTYGAAADQPGEWMVLNGNMIEGNTNYQSPQLADIHGVTTPVVMELAPVSGTGTFYWLDNLTSNGTSGNDDLLMDDIIYIFGGDYTVTFRNLLPGSYEIFTYAMAPDIPSGRTTGWMLLNLQPG